MKNKKCTFIFMLLFLAINHIQAQTSVLEDAKYKNGNIYQKDFLLFADMLYSTHPAFADTSTIDVEAIDKGYELLAKCSSLQQFATYIQSFLLPLNDSHTTVNLPFRQDYLFPISISVSHNKLYINALPTQYETHLNKEIKLIEGNNISQIENQVSKIFSHTTKQELYTYLANYIPICSLWEILGYQSDSLSITTVDGATFSIPKTLKTDIINNLKWINIQPTAEIREKNNIPFLYKFVNDNQICYLQINTMMDRSCIELQYRELMDSIKLENILKQYQRFDVFLENMFNDMENMNITTLVVDLRDNAGGNSALGDILLSYLKSDSTIQRYESYIRISNLWEHQQPHIANITRQTMADLHIPYQHGKLFNQNIIANSLAYPNDSIYFRHNNNNVFSGNVYFIMNEKTMSSAGMLITLVRDNQIGTIIGTESSFTASHYGDMLQWKLPNTGINGFISHKKFVRPNKNSSQNVIIPDMVIYDTPNDGVDDCWLYIQNNTKNKY